MPLFTTDFDNNLRGSAWDIGAYEYNGTNPGDAVPPTVNIVSPVDGGTVQGSAVVSASASDNVGVVGVQFKLDGVNLGTEDTTSPYSINWNTATVVNGIHTLSATARDAAGLTATHSITVTVNNVVTPPAPPTLIAAYAFNEGSGLASNDVSGKNHTATLTNAGWNNSGKYGNSLSLNGSTGYAATPDANDLDFTGAFTLSAWVYPTSSATDQTVLVKQHVYFLFSCYESPRTPMFGFVSGGQNIIVQGSSVLPLNVWSHLAGTYDGATIRLYVNGFEVSNRPFTGAVTTSASQLWIGSSMFNEFFAGRIDDVRIYSGALTRAAIQSDMNTPLSGAVPPTDTGLKLSYAFGEGSGGTTSDSSGNAHTGTISGATWTTSGKYGNALLFDGVNDFVSSPDANDLDFTTGMTLEAWVYPTSTLTSPAGIIVKEHCYFLYANLYNNLPQGGFSDGVVNFLATGTSTLAVNTWTHLAVTYDNVSVTLYVNGAQVSSLAKTGSIVTSSGQLRIGTSSFNEPFPGRIDNVRLYNRALSPAEIITNMNTAVAAGQDITPPTISSVASSNLTSSSARITWTTDEVSDTQVEYGPTTSYGSSSTLAPAQVTSHTVDLVGLTAGTVYNYRVKSKDPSNNLAISSNGTFTTTAIVDSTPPNISGVGAANLTPNSATINWTTNEASDSQVEYGPTVAYENGTTTLNPSLVTSHSVGLTGLTASTTYHYRVKSRDGAGNLATGVDNTFSTPAPPDTVGPIISNILASGITASGATISWITNENSSSRVDYGLTTSYGSSVVDSTLVMSHSVALSGLASGTIYHFKVTSVDASSNSTASSDGTFTTQVTPDTTAPIITNLQPSGTFPAGTSQVTLTCVTNEVATVKYSTAIGVAYADMPNTFTNTGGTSHSTVVSGLVNGGSYTYYIKAQDAAGNANSGDLYVVTFSVSSTPPPPPPATITVVSPNGGENWKIGSTRLIQWSSNGVTTNVNIEILRNGSYTTLFSNVSNSGSRSWTVTGGRSQQCRIRISTVDGSVVDSSNNFFKIT